MNRYTKIILLGIILLIVVSIVFVKLYKKDNFQGSCNFVPSGITLQECLDDCNVKRNMGDIACDKLTCENKCNFCSTISCQWKQDPNISNNNVNINSPLPAKIKGYIGDKKIKLIWIEPVTRLPITRYIIVCETQGKPTKFYYPSISSQLQEYILFNLENKREYKIRLFSENGAGMSVESNILLLKPQENSEIPIFSREIENLDDIDDSNTSSTRKFISEIDEKYKEKIGYDDEKKDYYELLKLLNDTKPNVDLQDEKIKIKFV